MAGRPRRACSNPFNTSAPVSRQRRSKQPFLTKDSLTCSNEKGSENGEVSGLDIEEQGSALEENILLSNKKYNGQYVRLRKGYLHLKKDSVTCNNEEGSDNGEQESVLHVDVEQESVLDVEQESVLDVEQESVLDVEQESVLDVEQESVLNVEQESVLDVEQESSNEEYNGQSVRLKKGYLRLRKDSLELLKESTCSNKEGMEDAGLEEEESIEDNVVREGQVGLVERDCVCVHQKEISTIRSLMGKVCYISHFN